MPRLRTAVRTVTPPGRSLAVFCNLMGGDGQSGPLDAADPDRAWPVLIDSLHCGTHHPPR